MIVVSEADVFKGDIVSVWLEFLRAFRRRRVFNLVQTICRHLRNEHFGDQRERLIERRVNAGDDHKKHEQKHKVDLSGKNERRAGEDRRRYAETHDDRSAVDEKPYHKFAFSVRLLKPVDLFVKTVQILFFAVGRPDLADVFK